MVELPHEILAHIFYFSLMDAQRFEDVAPIRRTSKTFAAIFDHVVVGAECGGEVRGIVERWIQLREGMPQAMPIATLEHFERLRSKLLFLSSIKEIVKAFPELENMEPKSVPDIATRVTQWLAKNPAVLTRQYHYHFIPKETQNLGIGQGGSTIFSSCTRDSVQEHGPSAGRKKRGIADAVQNQVLSFLRYNVDAITFLPPEIEHLTNLHALYLNRTRLSQGKLIPGGLVELPPQLCALENLTFMSIFNHRISSLPQEMGRLQKLTLLALPRNRLSSLSASCAHLTNLTHLDLSNNRFITFPPEICHLTQLVTLRFMNNQLTHMPAECVQLQNLRELIIPHNQFTAFPLQEGMFTSLFTLNISHNPLGALPERIGAIAYLELLEISETCLSSLPQSILHLRRLKLVYANDTPALHANAVAREVLAQLKARGAHIVHSGCGGFYA